MIKCKNCGKWTSMEVKHLYFKGQTLLRCQHCHAYFQIGWDKKRDDIVLVVRIK